MTNDTLSQGATEEVPFTITSRRIENNYSFQLYTDFGSTESGPWLVLGINDTEYGMGYLPEQQLVKMGSPKLAAV